jgi:nicotinamide mononucleotide transporter
MKKKIIVTLQSLVVVYLITNMIINNLNQFDLLSTAMGLLGLFGNILLTHKKESTFALNMTNNVLGFILSFQNRFFAEVLMNAYYFITQAFVGIPYFKRNKDESGNVKTTADSNVKQLAVSVGLGFIAMGAFSYFLNGNMVFLDSLQNAIAITAQFRQMNGKADGWLLWVVSNIINMIVWASVGNWILVASFGAYVVIALTGYWNWSE